jgi:protocatechuate 3,4-dioxygenase beta subunit
MFRFLFYILIFSFSSQAFAQVSEEAFNRARTHVVDDKIVNYFNRDIPSAFDPLRPTPSRFFSTDLSIPDKFATTNNLAKKVGSFYRAFGEIIFVQGVVTDSFGVPIDGAIIEIWQTNAAGKYHTLLEPGSEYIDKYFSMSGRTITDNLGNYHFITVMPGANIGRAPHINMNIYHPKFGKLETEMYFEKHPYNEGDYQYLSYDENDRKLITAKVRHSNILDTKSIKLCTFDIVLRGIHQYKKF